MPPAEGGYSIVQWPTWMFLENPLEQTTVYTHNDTNTFRLDYEPPEVPGDLRAQTEAPTLFRRYRFEELGLLEVVLCRPMNSDYGIYRDGVLIDDEGSDTGPGNQAISMYQLEVDPESELGWRVAGDQGLVWADCFETGDWPGAANIWRPRDERLKVLPQ